MAIRSTQELVDDTTAELVYEAVAGDLEIWVNASGTCLLGDAVDQKFNLQGNQLTTLNIKVRPGDKLYAISISGNSSITVLVRSA